MAISPAFSAHFQASKIQVGGLQVCHSCGSRNPELLIFSFWIPVPRFREDKFQGNDTLMP
jgi:hypothetical protein